MLRRFVLLAGLYSLLSFCSPPLHAQIEWDAACAVDDGEPCDSWSSDQHHTVLIAAPDCYADVTYKFRMCGGQMDIVVTGWNVFDGCENWDERSDLHYKRTGFKEYIILSLISKVQFPTIPSCPTMLVRANVYTAACGIWACCEYTLPDPPTYYCPPEWGNDPAPHYGVSPIKVKSCKWKSCGVVCCRRRYNICKNDANKVLITLIDKTRIGDCTGQDVPVPFNKQCEDGC